MRRIKRREFLSVAGATVAGGCSSMIRVCQGAEGKNPRVSVVTKGTSAGGAISLGKQVSGSEVWQVTTEEFDQSNIYCEVPYCSSDSRYFVYARQNPKLSGRNRTEFMVVEIGTWKQHRLDVSTGLTGCAISPTGTFYYLKQADDGSVNLMRADPANPSPQKMCRINSPERLKSLGTVTTDGRYYACGVRVDDQYKMFGVLLANLHSGSQTIIDRDPFILNPHPQFEPGKGRQLMIQHNRGGTMTPDGKVERLVGPEGATLYLLSVPDGRRTQLEVGKPYTTPATGHEAWIGDTDEILLTVAAQGDYSPDRGNLLAVRAGRRARVVARGYRFNHVGVSRCGRYFSCDDWQKPCKLVIGSIKTGRTAVVCESQTSMGRAQNTHPHAYLTPDLKWLVFNSDRSGWPQIHVASVPDSMIKNLL